jgi:restriction system protein
MIRAGRGGKYASEWLEEQQIAIYWDLGGIAIDGCDRDTIRQAYAKSYVGAEKHQAAAAVGQIYRFASEVIKGSTVVMYDPATRLYHIGKVMGSCRQRTSDKSTDAFYSRKVTWEKIAERDVLGPHAKHALGSIATLFSIADDTLDELLAATDHVITDDVEDVEDEDAAEARYATFDDGIERIKDKVLSLSWEDMELLVAGLLRTMGYKTSMTRKGPDGGRDVIASPDGLGLSSPRIIAEVKHRKGTMGAPQVRSFIGGLRNSDSGLYVSTGGFTKDAMYEAERATMPVQLLNLDQFVHLMVENYERADEETRTILPLVRLYWPA